MSAKLTLSMQQTAEAEYDNFLAQIGKELTKIDPQLAVQVMYYERKFPDVEPNVELHIHYKEGVNTDRKKDELDYKYGYLLAKEEKHAIRATGLMTLGRIYEISQDSDIDKITGFATCASY